MQRIKKKADFVKLVELSQSPGLRLQETEKWLQETEKWLTYKKGKRIFLTCVCPSAVQDQCSCFTIISPISVPKSVLKQQR